MSTPPLRRAGQRPSARALAALLPLVAAAACNPLEIPDPVQRRVGAIAIRGSTATATTARASATVIFFEVLNAPFPSSIASQDDACAFGGVDTTTVETRGVGRAGATVGLRHGTTPLTLAWDAAYARYATAAGAPFEYRTGDTATVTIPGDAATFPATSISVPLVAPLIPRPLALPAAGQPIDLRWEPGPDPSAAIILSLRYPNPASVTYNNAQVLCRLRDDGAHLVPAALVEQYLGSPAARRTVTLTRWRTNEAILDDRTLLHIVSSIDTTFTPQ